MPSRRIVVKAAGYGVAAAIAAGAAAVSLQASNAGIDQYNAAHMGNPVPAQRPGWSCGGQGCAVRALQTNVAE